MTTKFAKPLEASQVTHVADMPPLEVVTEGIPPQEHVELTPAAQVEAPPEVRDGRGRMWAWALAGVMGLLLVVAGVFTFTQLSSTGTSDLTPPAGQAFPTAETASEPYGGMLFGDPLPYISDMAIPSIASLPDMTIPSIAALPEMTIPSIPDMSMASFPSIAAMSIPTIASLPEMTIPAIPAISFPSTPTTPTTPVSPTTPATFPAIPSMSIPSIQSISFPSFPSIPSITVPSIPSFPSIPEM